MEQKIEWSKNFFFRFLAHFKTNFEKITMFWILLLQKLWESNKIWKSYGYLLRLSALALTIWEHTWYMKVNNKNEINISKLANVEILRHFGQILRFCPTFVCRPASMRRRRQRWRPCRSRKLSGKKRANPLLLVIKLIEVFPSMTTTTTTDFMPMAQW